MLWTIGKAEGVYFESSIGVLCLWAVAEDWGGKLKFWISRTFFGFGGNKWFSYYVSFLLIWLPIENTSTGVGWKTVLKPCSTVFYNVCLFLLFLLSALINCYNSSFVIGASDVFCSYQLKRLLLSLELYFKRAKILSYRAAPSLSFGLFESTIGPSK